METKRSGHAVYRLGVHLVWCTKFRHDVLVGPVELRCKIALAETCREYGWSLRNIEVMSDHVHLFVEYSPDVALSDMVRTLKSISAVRVFDLFPDLKKNKFWGSGLWSRSYFAASVGSATEKVINEYIDNQKKNAK